MINLVLTLAHFLAAHLDRSEKGEVSIEYVLVGGLAALAIIAGMAVLFPAAAGWFDMIATTVTGALT